MSDEPLEPCVCGFVRSETYKYSETFTRRCVRPGCGMSVRGRSKKNRDIMWNASMRAIKESKNG